MFRSLPYFALAISIVIGLATPGLAQSEFEKIAQGLSDRVEVLRQQIEQSTKFVSDSRKTAADKQRLIASAPEDTQKMIDDLEKLVEEFKTGGEIEGGMRAAMGDLTTRIEKYSNSDSTVQRQVAEQLRGALVTIQEADGRRDLVVAKALQEVRRLKASKDDLVALREAGLYDDLAQLYTAMVDSFEETVNVAADVSNDIDRVGDVAPQ